jgi:cytoplasmic FMR1 interacting protein
VEMTSYIKGLGTMMERVDTLIADAIWEVLHAQVQEFVQNKLATMLRTTFKKKKDLARILTDMRIIAADWMGNSSEYNTGHVSKLREEGAGVPVTFRSRPAAPTAAQVLLASCMNLYVDVALD